MSRTILIVEDNQVSRKLLRTTLERHGYRTFSAYDAENALEAFDCESIDLILMDLILPDTSGFDLVKKIRDLPGGAGVPILACTGYLSHMDEERFAAASFDDILTKPIEPSRLIPIVSAHLPLEDSTEVFGDGRVAVVVDDDQVQQKLVAFRLRHAGFVVETARDGQIAIDVINDVEPDVVVSDVLMPNLDGFGLCLALQESERWADLPVVLTTNSYLASEDRDFARRAGAFDLVVRTPDLGEVLSTVEAALESDAVKDAKPTESRLVTERLSRLTSQLERQVSIRNRVSRRCALLSTELALIRAVSDSLVAHDNLDDAIRTALDICFDAGGISVGVLYRAYGDDYRSLAVGLPASIERGEIDDFFGERDTLMKSIASEELVYFSSKGDASPALRRVLSRTDTESAILVPLVHSGERLGALLMMSKRAQLQEADFQAFGRTIASQMAQALVMARAFERQEESEMHAREQAAMLESILDSIGDGVVVVDRSGKFTHWNRAASEVMRKGPLAAGPDTWSSEYGLFETDQETPISTDDLPLVKAIEGEVVERRELYMKRGDVDGGRWLSIHARPWTSEGGDILGGVAAIRDVTDEKEMQAHLLTADRMVSIGLLAAGVAHEINNPLAAVSANLELARNVLRGDFDPGDRENLKTMVDDAMDATVRMRSIVRDLSVFSREDSIEAYAVDVEEVLESTIRMAWNEVRHRCELETDFEGIPRVEGTDSRLGQVFLNLIVNAAQAFDDDGADKATIWVSTRQLDDDRVVVEIEDNGPGMSAELLSKIFSPFFTTKPAGTGTGLGLAICKRIVEELDGSIEVDSDVGMGTTFRICLRVAADQRARPEPTKPDPEAEECEEEVRRGRILIIDDDERIRRLMKRVFRKAHDVQLADGGESALELLEAGESFDLIFCDVMMPGMTGVELFQRLGVDFPDLTDRVVFVTGGAFTPATKEFLAEVSNPRISKPFKIDELRRFASHFIQEFEG